MVRRITQYPDLITLTRETTTQDDNGNMITSKVEITHPCRFVPNSKGRIIATADGGNYTFSYQIAFPFGITDVKVGDVCEKGTIMQFEIGQLHSVGWI